MNNRRGKIQSNFGKSEHTLPIVVVFDHRFQFLVPYPPCLTIMGLFDWSGQALGQPPILYRMYALLNGVLGMAYFPERLQ